MHPLVPPSTSASAWRPSVSRSLAAAAILVAIATSATVAHAHSHSHEDHHTHGHSHAHALPESLANLAAIFGDDSSSLLIACTVLLTTVPLVLMLALPKNLPGPVERVLVSFALGTMLSDIFLHLLPETLAAGGSAHSHSHSHSNDDHHHDHHHHAGILATPAHKVLAGFLAFYAIERIMGLLVAMSSSTTAHSHSHSHSHSHDSKKHDGDCNHAHDHDDSSTPSATKSDVAKDGLRQRASNKSTTAKPAAEPHTKKPAATNSALPPINAIIHVFATSIHVASDGLLVSMAFSRGPSTGLSTFLGVFLHEIPHRLADWALIQGGLGMTRNQAIVAQLYMTCASLVGVFAGAALVPASAIEQMMPIVAGGLLYTATVGVVPELTGGHSHGHDHGGEGHGHEHEHGHSHSHEEGGAGRIQKLVQVVVEIGALVGGIAFMGNHAH